MAPLSGKARGDAVLVIEDGFMVRLFRGPSALETGDHESFEPMRLSSLHFEK